MTIVIVNKHQYHGPGIYVGRPSPLGNPYSHLKGQTLAEFHVDTRKQSIEQYEPWLRKQLVHNTSVKLAFNRLVELYLQTGQLILICWCSPLPCHAEILRNLIYEEIARQTPPIIPTAQTKAVPAKKRKKAVEKVSSHSRGVEDSLDNSGGTVQHLQKPPPSSRRRP